MDTDKAPRTLIPCGVNIDQAELGASDGGKIFFAWNAKRDSCDYSLSRETVSSRAGQLADNMTYHTSRN